MLKIDAYAHILPQKYLGPLQEAQLNVVLARWYLDGQARMI
jgi:hypothetical protein